MLKLLVKVQKKKKVYLVLYYKITHLKCPACLIHKITSRGKMTNNPDFKSKERKCNTYVLYGRETR